MKLVKSEMAVGALVEARFTRVWKDAAGEGRYILASDHSVQVGIPPENVKFTLEAARKLVGKVLNPILARRKALFEKRMVSSRSLSKV